MSPGNLLRKSPDRRIITMPKRYSERVTMAEAWKKAAAMTVMMGSLALQGMNEVQMTETVLLDWSSMVLVPMMAGTLHPIPMTAGMTALPESPK